MRHRPILDIGCGTGGTLASSPRSGIGIDCSLSALRFCRGRGQRFVAQADAAHLPFADASFSCALMLDILYHRAVPDPTAVLREAHRAITPGGHIIVNVPAYDWLRSSHDEAIHTERRFTRPQLRALLTAAGFDVTRATYWNTLLFPAAAAVRVMRRRRRRDVSDLAGYRPGVGSEVASAVVGLEASVLRLADLPFGLSILAVARKI
jgi:ubiquinone/menaquinone biosynthesis C-methylase UbiE